MWPLYMQLSSQPVQVCERGLALQPGEWQRQPDEGNSAGTAAGFTVSLLSLSAWVSTLGRKGKKQLTSDGILIYCITFVFLCGKCIPEF